MPSAIPPQQYLCRSAVLVFVHSHLLRFGLLLLGERSQLRRDFLGRVEDFDEGVVNVHLCAWKDCVSG